MNAVSQVAQKTKLFKRNSIKEKGVISLRTTHELYRSMVLNLAHIKDHWNFRNSSDDLPPGNCDSWYGIMGPEQLLFVC